MEEDFYVERRGWCKAPHGLGHWQECFYDDVLASRDFVGHYSLFLSNWVSLRPLDKILPKDCTNFSFLGTEGKPVDGRLVRDIMRARGTKCASFIDFDVLPALENPECVGFYDEECAAPATHWTIPSIDGYTTHYVPVCEAHARKFSEDFASCPFYPDAKRIELI